MAEYREIEIRIQQALAVAEKQENPNYAQLAREFNVPIDRLRGRAKGLQSRSSRPPTNMRLNEAQELAIVEYIKILDDLGLEPTRRIIQKTANSLLPEDQPPLGARWVSRFLLRNPQFSLVKQKKLEVDRFLAHRPTTIQQWYDGLQRLYDMFNFDAHDVYNMDETGFRVGIGREEWVVTRYPKREHWTPIHGNREHITVVEAISADGSVLSPYIILPAKHHQSTWYIDKEDGGFTITMSDSGYINDQLALDWIHLFVKWSGKRQVGRYRLLLLDGHESHCTREFLTVCKDNMIIPYFLIPHTTHLAQPLDVVAFGVYKHYHSQEVTTAWRTGCTDFNRHEFLAVLESIRQKTFKSSTIHASFFEAGIWPVDASKSLSRIPTRPETPPPLPRPRRSTHLHSSGSIHTPITSNAIERSVTKLQSLLSPSAERVIRGLDKLAKGSLTIAHLADTLKRDMEQIRTAAEQRQVRKRLKKTVLQKGGLLSVDDARQMVKQIEDKKVEEAKRIVEKDKAAKRRQAKKEWDPWVSLFKKQRRLLILYKKDYTKLQRKLHKELLRKVELYI
jgi:hypothetical protein